MSEVVFVMGATGNIGREVVRQLAEAGRPVRAGVRKPAAAAALHGANVEIVQADYDRPGHIAAALAGCDALFVVNGLSPAMGEQCRILADAARDAGVGRIVRASMMSAEVAEPILVARWHRAAERAIEAAGVPFTHLRPNTFMQNFSNMHAESIRRTNSFFGPLGEGRTSYVDVRDIAAAAVAVLTQAGHENKSYTLTGGEALSAFDIALLLSGALGRRITYVETPAAAARRALDEVGATPVMADALMQLFAAMKDGACAAVVADLERLLGRPPISFAQFAKDHARVFELIV